LNSRELIRRTKAAATELARASKWRSSLKEFDADEDHYVYELFCYFSAALAAAEAFEVDIVAVKHPRTGKRAALWPRGPGNKPNFSYIKLNRSVELNGSEPEPLFELCPGIRIVDRYGKARAADINLLRTASPDAPTWQDLYAIWDAKYVYKSDKRLSDEAVADFAYTFKKLGAPSAPSSWTRAVAGAAFRYSGLLTNGAFSTEPAQALREDGIYETSDFPRAPKTRPKQPLQVAVVPRNRRRAGE
jgi:hypothetical protein